MLARNQLAVVDRRGTRVVSGLPATALLTLRNGQGLPVPDFTSANVCRLFVTKGKAVVETKFAELLTMIVPGCRRVLFFRSRRPPLRSIKTSDSFR